MRQDKEEKQLTASVSASPLTTYGVDRTCFITNHAISAKSHLIEWVGSFWSNTAEKCALRLNQPCLIWYVGCIIIGLCLSIGLIVNYDRLAAWVPHCNGVWLIEAETNELYTPTQVLRGTRTNVHTHARFVVRHKHESAANASSHAHASL